MADQIAADMAPIREVQIPGAAASPGVAGLPSQVAVKLLNRKSADVEIYGYAWDLMWWFYVSGCELEAVAEQFLKKRSKELPDVYQSRVERFYAESHISTAVDWYLSALFEIPPQVETSIDDDSEDATDAVAPPVQPPAPAPLTPGQPPPMPTPPQQLPPPRPRTMTPAQADDFYDRFEQNCDRAGMPLQEMFRAYFRNLLIFGRGVMLVDLPNQGDHPPANLLEQQQRGLLDPYLTNYDPRTMINYERDTDGRMLWVIFSTRSTETPSPFEASKVTDRWYYYDQKVWAVYEREVPQGEAAQPTGAPSDAVANKTGEGPHCMANYNGGTVPIMYDELPKGLWLLNRAYSVAKEHLNTSNAYSWALYMSCLAMPVVCMDGDYEIELSEVGFIKLPKDATYTWSEPQGKSFEHMANRVENLKEEIFRSFYLIAQARSTSATASAQSGVSKQQDMTAPAKILNLFGDVMRAMIQNTYDAVSAARKDNFDWDVRGLSFPEGPPDQEIDTVAGAQALGIQSLTFEKELQKKAVMATLPDMNPKIKAQIFTEIDTAPSMADQESNMLSQRAQMVMTKDTFPNGSV